MYRAKSWPARLAAVCLLLTALPASVSCAEPAPDTAAVVTDYEAYVQEGGGRPAAAVEVTAAQYAGQDADILEGKSGVRLVYDQTAEWVFTAEEAGLYNLKVSYYAYAGKSAQVEVGLTIGGTVPFEGCSALVLPKIFTDGQGIRKDKKGNDIRPVTVEQPCWQEIVLTDAMGYQSDPLLFRLEKGENRVAFTALNDDVFIASLTFFQQEEIPSYADYQAQHAGARKISGFYRELEAETPARKSSPLVYAVTDRNSALVQPVSGAVARLNAIGGTTWNQTGQWVEYDFTVPETGLYTLTLKVKQNLVRGMKSYRRVLIDGGVPFQELENVGFAYSSSWRQETLGGKEPYLFWLEAGPHTIRVENVPGEYGPLIEQVNETVAALNEAYLQIIMYMSASPDINRDYAVEKNLPEVLVILREQRDRLQQVSAQLADTAGSGGGDKAAILNTLRNQLEKILKDPEKLAKQLSSLKTNITALSTWLVELGNQPLMMDYITVSSADKTLKRADGSFFENAWHELKNFFYTFVNDYSLTGNSPDAGEAITVWVPTGRDQAGVIKRLVEDSFSKEKNIPVNLQLVNASMVTPAIAGGIGPDVILQMNSGDPVNLGLRGAILDLNTFVDCKDVQKRFAQAALVPLQFQNCLYGLPETQDFPMLFYREDILAKLDIDVPETWGEMVYAISELSRNNMAAGINGADFGLFLLQSGGAYYRKDTYYTDLLSDKAVQAFDFWTGLYIDYKVPQTYDFVTRFRLGEMPLAIANFSTFSTLQITAPEIRGLWNFTLVPGMEREDGTVDHSVLNTGTAAVILAASDRQKESWEFLKWWTQADIQSRYGREIEATLGASARYVTANLEAFETLDWTAGQLRSITAQRKWTKGLEAVPGGYYLTRHISNAFRKVVYSAAEPRETLLEYSRVIDAEIERKLREFRLAVQRLA